MPRENHSGVSAQDRLVRPSVRPLQTQGGETAGRASPKEVLMPLKDSVPEVRTLMTGLMFGESPRWRDGRFWVSDWVAHEIIAVDLEGKSEVVVREPSIPLCFDFLPDGTPGYHERSAYPAPRTRRVAGDPADLTGLSELGWNEIVVDGRANAYVNAAGFDLMAAADFVPGTVAVVTADGSARQVAADLTLQV